MSTKNMWLAIVALIALLAVVAAFVFIKPDQSDRPQIQPPSVEDNVEDQRDEITGDNMTGVGVTDEDKNDVGVVTPNPDAAKDENPNAQKPEQDTPPVDGDQDKDTETSKPDDTNKDEDTTPPKQEDTTPPATTPDDDEDVTPPSGSGNSGNSDGSIGTTNVGGSIYRQFPDDYNVNTITPQKPFERVMIGNDEYLWDGSSWNVVDNTQKPNDYSDISGDPFSGSQGMH